MADTVNAVNRCCANVKRAESELVQPRPPPDGLVLRAGGLPLRPLPTSLFRANTLSFSLSSRCFLHRFLPSFSRRVGCSTPNTTRLLHRRHRCLLACDLRAYQLSSLRVPRFRGGVVPTLGDCQYITNRSRFAKTHEAFKRAPRSLRGACLLGGFAKPTNRLREPFVEAPCTEASTKTPWSVHKASSKGSRRNFVGFQHDYACNSVGLVLYCFIDLCY